MNPNKRLITAVTAASALLLLQCVARALDLEYKAASPYTSRAYAIYNPGSNCYGGNCIYNYGYSLDEIVTSTLPPKFLPADVYARVENRAISGRVTCGTTACSGDTEHRRFVYVAATPDTNVRVKVEYSLAVSGGLTKTAAVSFGGVEHRVPDGNLLTKSGELSAIVKTRSTGEPINGRTFYKLDLLTLSGTAGGTSGTAEFSGSVSNISARYIGKALYYNSGGGQTGRAGQTLPLSASVKVLDEATNSPVTGNVQIAFYITDPNGVVTGLGQAWKDYYSGIADKAIPLGLIPGTYTITAVCPDYICVEGGRTVTMTAVARGKALVCVDCAYHGRVSRELENPFRLKVVDMFDGSAATGAVVTYQFLRFTDTNNNTSADPHGAEVTRVLNAQSDIYGMSRAFLKLGRDIGVYAVRARCDSCLEGQEQIPTGTAHGRTVVIEAEEETAGDPTPNQEPCPSGCCPYTPVVRAWAVPAKGPGIFTSADNENEVQLGGLVLPLCLNASNSITWRVEDDSIDHRSGTPAQPSPGAVRTFLVGSGDFPVPTDTSNRPIGRALPLAYKVTASYDYKGAPTPITATRHIKQDEIDKCRQEYFDVSTAGEDLRPEPYFSRYVRNKFTLGVDGAIDPDYVKFIDCFAHIFPSRAQEVENLRINPAINFPIDVISGYRSPRKNRIQRPQGKWNSVHQFGGGVDIVPKTMTAQNKAERFKALWYNTSCPKILETGAAKVMAVCDVGQSTSTYKEIYNESNVFGLANCVHLGD